jgi:hypothetical protein
MQRLYGVAALEQKTPAFFCLTGYTPAAVQWAHRAQLALFTFGYDSSVQPYNEPARELGNNRVDDPGANAEFAVASYLSDLRQRSGISRSIERYLPAWVVLTNLQGGPFTYDWDEQLYHLVDQVLPPRSGGMHSGSSARTAPRSQRTGWREEKLRFTTLR